MISDGRLDQDVAHMGLSLLMGVDPGFSGAVAFYNFKLKKLEAVFDMPIEEINGRKRIHAARLTLKIREFNSRVAFAVIEDVGARPNEGVSSVFKFGFGAGIVTGICAGLNIPVHYSKPAVWKALVGVTYDKNTSLEKARKLFPTHLNEFKRKKDNGRAEAALLASFGERLIFT